jgi:hypothetical protein
LRAIFIKGVINLKLPRQNIVLMLSLMLFLCLTSVTAFSAAADGAMDTSALPRIDYGDAAFVPGEVLAPADSVEQAQEIAAAYGLELKSYAWGIAVMAAADPEQAVAQSPYISGAPGNEAGRPAIPLLSLNNIGNIYGISTSYDDNYYVPAGIDDNPYAPAGNIEWYHTEMGCEQAWALSTG